MKSVLAIAAATLPVYKACPSHGRFSFALGVVVKTSPLPTTGLK